jgi:tRNA A37 N6-isopentenylltransferase MiaA
MRYCIAMAGANRRPTSVIRKAIRRRRKRGKKLPDTLAQLRQEFAQGAPIRLMFQDEARFGRITEVRRAWAPYPLRPMCRATVTREYTYAYAAVDADSDHLDTLILPHVNTDCMQIFLEEVASRHPDEKLVRVMDGAGWHASKALRAPDNIRWLPLPA